MIRNLTSDATGISPIVALVFMAAVVIVVTTVASLLLFGYF